MAAGEKKDLVDREQESTARKEEAGQTELETSEAIAQPFNSTIILAPLYRGLAISLRQQEFKVKFQLSKC